MEAALLQTYAPRDPIGEYVAGKVSLRQLRVMVEHLPPGCARDRAVVGPWRDRESMMWDISARLRDLLSLTFNIHRGPDTAAIHLPHLPTPEPTDYQRERAAEQERQRDAERQDLLRVLNRPGRGVAVQGGR